ncbi:DUF7344 domain-containing protein [Natrinema salaciae]|uniref:DUF7344 domain-containing protein n=1 Tax=Natrinema salaciae TaxID=1186196 RepID=A0A1H9QE68_9EURY|nr:hypothetical protein [Natrinema salaciae]SER58103.1 hypothetical protein SAMN04489841_4163 [Natrinema salaciae]
MSSPPDTETTTIAADVLAEPRRRYLLATLLDREGAPSSGPPPTARPVSVATLATEVATAECDRPIVTDDQCEEIHITLVHNHIPRLVDIGVLRRDTDGDATTVTLRDHPMLAADWVRTLLADPTGEGFAADEATLNRTLEALSDARRRTVCTALATQRGAVDVRDLAAMVVERESGDGTGLVDVTETDCASVATTLVHKHLPALASAGLVAHDDAENRVELATDAPQWQADWVLDGPLAAVGDLVPAREFRERPDESIRNETGADAPAANERREAEATSTGPCRTIEGRETVIAAGHDIADSADEELFLTIPDAELLQRTCLERWRDAADRGVDVYVGSDSPRVRDTVRSAIPSATVCEPQLDWLNLPIERGNHGRVFFADRETAMLVTVDDSRSDENGEPRVGAITGHGRENALVSLVREHMGPRLDRLTAEHDARDETPLQI